jgi:aromatic ring-opening dioxygenase catalytic subunit (LigB family)
VSTANPIIRLPVFFLSHGGGPWPWIEGMRGQYAETVRQFARIPSLLPARPRVVLIISGHWEMSDFTISTSAHPPMVYDYGGFPAHTYQIQYPAPGMPELAQRVRELLGEVAEDAQRGFDHGSFVPLSLMYPRADVPVVMLSMKSGYDPQQHLELGRKLAPLREEGVLIIGSGLTYHNMRGFGRPDSMAQSQAFEAYLADAVTDPAQREQQLLHWEQAPFARQVHPHEDHLMPLLVVAGAADGDPGERLFVENVMGVAMASYKFG